MAITNKTAMNIGTVSVMDIVSFILDKCLGEEWLDHGRHMFSFFRNCQIAFQSEYTVFCFYQQCINILIPPHPHQHLVWSVFLIWVISDTSLWLRFTFPEWQWCYNLFMYFLVSLYLIWWSVCSCLLPMSLGDWLFS